MSASLTCWWGMVQNRLSAGRPRGYLSSPVKVELPGKFPSRFSVQQPRGSGFLRLICKAGRRVTTWPAVGAYEMECVRVSWKLGVLVPVFGGGLVGSLLFTECLFRFGVQPGMLW